MKTEIYKEDDILKDKNTFEKCFYKKLFGCTKNNRDEMEIFMRFLKEYFWSPECGIYIKDIDICKLIIRKDKVAKILNKKIESIKLEDMKNFTDKIMLVFFIHNSIENSFSTKIVISKAIVESDMISIEFREPYFNQLINILNSFNLIKDILFYDL